MCSSYVKHSYTTTVRRRYDVATTSRSPGKTAGDVIQKLPLCLQTLSFPDAFTINAPGNDLICSVTLFQTSAVSGRFIATCSSIRFIGNKCTHQEKVKVNCEVKMKSQMETSRSMVPLVFTKN